MKNLITLFVLLLFSSHAMGALSCPEGFSRIHGEVEDVIIEEVDEDHVGEVCITFVRYKLSLIGIVENILDCELADAYIEQIGSEIHECVPRLRKIRDKDQIRVLKAVEGPAYYLEKEFQR